MTTSPKRGRPPKALPDPTTALTQLSAALRRLRQDRGLTLMELGRISGCSWQHLGAVERGQVNPSEQVVVACERALAAGGRLVALFPAVVAEQAAARHEASAARRGVDPVSDESHDWARLSAAANRQSRVSAQVLEELEEITDRQRTLYHSLSSAQMIVPVEAHLGLLSELLSGDQPTRLRHRLASAAGEAAGFAAWLWFDLGDHHKMSSLYRMSGDLLDEGADPALRCYVSGYRALAHEASGLGSRAVIYADEALARIPSSASRLTRSWLCAVSASASALVSGHRDAVPGLLGLARDHLDAADGREPWMYDFDQTALSGYEGQCQLRLGQSDQAATAFSGGLLTLPEGHDRRGAQLNIGLAEALLRSGERDEALDRASIALEVFALRGSASGLRRVRRIRDLFASTGQPGAAAELDERARVLLQENIR